MNSEVARGELALSPARMWALVAIAWLLFGLGSGSLEWLATHRHTGAAWSATVWSLVLAAAIWIPLTFGAVAAARRWPPWPPRPRHLAIHISLSLAVSFLLNFLWSVGAAALTSLGYPGANLDWDEVAELWYQLGLANLALNGGAYWAIVALVTVWRVRGASAEPLGRAQAAGRWVSSLSVRRGNTTLVIPVNQIEWIEGAGDYARLHLSQERLLSVERLKTLEDKLDPAVFARVHRSAIINLRMVKSLSHQSHGDYLAVLASGAEVKVARSRRAALARFLSGTARE